MTDSLVERLREASEHKYHPSYPKAKLTLENQAADRIEELEEAVKGLDYYEECLALRKENDKLLFCQQWIAEQAREIEALKDKIDRCGVKHVQELKETKVKDARIEELEALLEEAHPWIVCVDDPEGLADRVWEALKATEAETPKRQKTDDHIVRLSDETAIDYVLPNDYLEHKQDTEQSLKWQEERQNELAHLVGKCRRRIEAWEERMLEAFPSASYRYSNWCEEESDPTPASHGSEDKTLDLISIEWQMCLAGAPVDKLPTERRSGKARRVLKSEESPDGTGFWNGTDFYPNRRKIARRKSDRREE